MKRASSFLFVVLLALPSGILAVVGAPSASQTLRWGVSENQEFEFRLRTVTDSSSVLMDETMWLCVESLPELVTQFTTMQRIPIAPVLARWENGTEVKDYDDFFVWVDRFVLPIGDWPLVESYIADESMDHFVIVESKEFWGFQWSTYIDEIMTTVRVVYFREDGFMSHYSFAAQRGRTGDVFLLIDSARQDLRVNLGGVILSTLHPSIPIALVLSGVLFVTFKLRRPQSKLRVSSTGS